MTERFVFYGRDEIALAIGESPKRIGYLVKHEGLPAFRASTNRAWKALPEDLQQWVRDQRTRCIHEPQS